MDDKHEKTIDILEKIFSIVGVIVSVVFAITQNSFVIFISGGLCVVLVIGIINIIRRKKKLLIIEGEWIEEVGKINLFAKRKNSLNPIIAIHKCLVYSNKLTLEYEYEGICCSKKGCSSMALNIVSDTNQELDDMKWEVYDLKNDPEGKIKLSPHITTPKGSTKRAEYKFIKRINYNKKFHIKSIQTIKYDGDNTDKDHFASVLTFKDRPIDKYVVILEFYSKPPKKVVVYDVKNNEGVYDKLLICKTDENKYIYEDNIEDGNGWSARVYIWEF